MLIDVTIFDYSCAKFLIILKFNNFLNFSGVIKQCRQLVEFILCKENFSASIEPVSVFGIDVNTVCSVKLFVWKRYIKTKHTCPG